MVMTLIFGLFEFVKVFYCCHRCCYSVQLWELKPKRMIVSQCVSERQVKSVLTPSFKINFPFCCLLFRRSIRNLPNEAAPPTSLSLISSFPVVSKLRFCIEVKRLEAAADVLSPGVVFNATPPPLSSSEVDD